MTIEEALTELDQLKSEKADKAQEHKELVKTLENIERDARSVRREIDSRRDDLSAIDEKIKRAVHAADGLCQKTIRLIGYRKPSLCEKKAKPGQAYCGIHLRGKK